MHRKRGMKRSEAPEFEHQFRLGLLGDKGVGKTELCHALRAEHIESSRTKGDVSFYQSTLEVDALTGLKVRLQLVDLTGRESRRLVNLN